MLKTNPDLFEADIAQLAYERRERQAHRVPAAPSPKDIEQDTRIRSLERENRRLQCYITALVDVMRNAGMIRETQLQTIVAEAEWAKLQNSERRGNSSESPRHDA